VVANKKEQATFVAGKEKVLGAAAGI